jgi:hypothetical protein
MHGSPWLRASEATRVRRRQINGLERLERAIGVLIGALDFALGKISVLEFALNGLVRPSHAAIGANNELRFRARTTLGSAVAALIDNGASQPQKIRPGRRLLRSRPSGVRGPVLLPP